MKPTCLILAAALSLSSAHADALSAPEREALLQKLEEMRANAESKVDARYRAAIAAYQAAMASDDAAMELYLNCVEKVNFKDQQRKNADFREWKRREEDRLSDPGIGLALRLQLRWLILTLRAASEKTERDQSRFRCAGSRGRHRQRCRKTQKPAPDPRSVRGFIALRQSLRNRRGQGERLGLSPRARSARFTKKSSCHRCAPPGRPIRSAAHGSAASSRKPACSEFLPEEQDEGGKRRIGMANDMRSPE